MPAKWNALKEYFKWYIETQSVQSESEYKIEDRKRAEEMIDLIAELQRDPELIDVQAGIEIVFVKLRPVNSKRSVTFIARINGVEIWIDEEVAGEVNGTRKLVPREDFVHVIKNELAKLGGLH